MKKAITILLLLYSCRIFAIDYKLKVGTGYACTFRQANFSHMNVNLNEFVVSPFVDFFLTTDKKWSIQSGLTYYYGYYHNGIPKLFADDFYSPQPRISRKLIFQEYQESMVCHTLSLPVYIGYCFFQKDIIYLRFLFGADVSYRWGKIMYETTTLKDLDRNTLLEINGTIKVGLDYFELPIYSSVGLGLETTIGNHFYVQFMCFTGLFDKARKEYYPEERFCYQERLQFLCGVFF